jgi:UDP-N-acetylmuramoyl-L-alanyl-D-glutamate--2,6-diaminopimelate ligase
MRPTLAYLLGSDAALPAGADGIIVTGMTADSREVKPGFLFAAMPGTRVDGAAFISQAVEAGAVAVIAQQAVAANVPVIQSDNVRKLFAQMAARFYGAQPDVVAAVTGTNGKTSVVVFVRQIWEAMGFRAASLGTIGVVGPSGSHYLQHTTPDPVTLHATLARLAEDHVKHLALEASSHGLAQYRLDGVRISAGAFTNITRDHLDYHATFEDYFSAKLRLFSELLAPGSPAVINADAPLAGDVIQVAKARGLEVFTVGRSGSGIRLQAARRDGFGQHLTLLCRSKVQDVYLPLAGDFQVSNAVVAAGLVIALGGEEAQTFHALESIKGARGRLDLAVKSASGAPVFVDYAHTPDALESAIASLRPYAKGRLVVVFGCGGDRDKGKRPQMGSIASRLADVAYVTDDNPRSEDPAVIRAEIMAACPKCIEIGDRAKAIHAAVDDLEAGDILLIAGKGHESGQIVGKNVLPFSDHEAARAAVRGEEYRG